MDNSTPPPAGQEPPITAQTVPPTAAPQAPHRPAPPPKPRGRGCLFALIVLLFVGGFLVLAIFGAVAMNIEGRAASEVREVHFSGKRLTSHKVAILRVEGLIADGEGYLKKQIDAIRDDDRVKAVVLRINSPGGTVSGSDYVYHHLTQLREDRQLPIVVSMGAICASGGYYIAMAVGDTPETIIAEPTTWTGSIGVIIPHYDLSGLLAEWKIQDDSIKSHPLKQLGSMTRPMSEEERAILQSLVNDSFDRFKEVVKSGRPHFREDPQALDAVATGAVFSTNQALDNGLVDAEGFLEDAIDRAIDLAGLDKDQVHVIEYERRFGLLEEMLMTSRARPRINWQSWVERATPQAYYLYSALPNLLETAP